MYNFVSREIFLKVRFDVLELQSIDVSRGTWIDLELGFLKQVRVFHVEHEICFEDFIENLSKYNVLICSTWNRFL